MSVLPIPKTESFTELYNEKDMISIIDDEKDQNPVISTSERVYKAINLVQINEEGVQHAARHIRQSLLAESYTPRTWRTHPLHICPKDPSLNWVFLISALNFSFWSEREGTEGRYGVEWWTGWRKEERTVHTGYWSLVAALDRALEENIPITDPVFYASEVDCPDSLIERVFRQAEQSTESIPLLSERIKIMREVGFILTNSFGGSFQGFLAEFQRLHDGDGTALDLVKMVIETFPSFRDQFEYEGSKVCLWKRAQILVAETWAAFYPATPTDPHPIFPGPRGPMISKLTMFADYRVPQILHHLRIITYPPSLVEKLVARVYLESGSKEELSLRTASIVAVERVREEILKIMREEEGAREGEKGADSPVSSVLIDFYLWDLAKKVEAGVETIEGIETASMAPIHRTRSTWY
ncbi:hypothetical protein DFP72DRAFT_989993 [Ephemerocybe angulata]|uniref:Queuosine 5'-phosphate N-glycosylase/hydrolase n=1 Tax=Ephemerocybe angulata TaxID=980116 RepID=A0A8H6I0R1_9AGAR|nr:hypothetical protein DFP72DRAFT_989993 [Tulosesus angulatus]